MRGKGIRNKSCCIEPIKIAGALTAKHCGDSTSDCSNGVLIYPAKVVKPYGSTGGICGVKLGENKKDLSSPVCSRDYKGILRNDGDAILEFSELPLAYDEQNNILRKDGTVGTLTNRVIVGGNSVRIRRLTPRECWRLQGFPDSYFDKAKAAGISDTQLYKMAGNAVSVPVAKAIGLRLMEIEQCEDTSNLATID